MERRQAPIYHRQIPFVYTTKSVALLQLTTSNAAPKDSSRLATTTAAGEAAEPSPARLDPLLLLLLSAVRSRLAVVEVLRVADGVVPEALLRGGLERPAVAPQQAPRPGAHPVQDVPPRAAALAPAQRRGLVVGHVQPARERRAPRHHPPEPPLPPPPQRARRRQRLHGRHRLRAPERRRRQRRSEARRQGRHAPAQPGPAAGAGTARGGHRELLVLAPPRLDRLQDRVGRHCPATVGR
ncbi:hypothetical protein PVAP13_6KG365718 [Panicum virgatum]|uniref:Uncharacterized protein n=1 Tax=Panicum virgatum TaxID=38727 RepID=A0A8T0RIL3_PANVG|nr:hypothetical protein PVAP13_6KG365718 [Panicum virgatum]